MSILSKYKGIDERQIKCCCNNPDCKEAGVSFDEGVMRFHFLEPIDGDRGNGHLTQRCVAMKLDKKNTRELINELKSYL